jgi:hypothetical protein
MPILVNPGLADGVGWVVEGMVVDAVVMRSVSEEEYNQTMGQTHLTARKRLERGLQTRCQLRAAGRR